jgi:hypothetical protein
MFTYFAIVASTLLIVLRMYVSLTLRLSSRSKALKETLQNCHLGQAEDCFCIRNELMGGGHLIPYRW